MDFQGEKLGSGSYGTVVGKDSDVAVKTYKNNDLCKYEEIDILLSIKHPNIISCDGIAVNGLSSGLMMRRCDMTLDDYLTLPMSENVDESYTFRIVDSVRCKLSDDQYVSVCHQLISALHLLHVSEIAHCDLKGNNVLIRKDRILLTDFGMSCKSHSADKRDVGCCSTLEWKPMDLIYLSHDGEYEKILGGNRNPISSFKEKVNGYYGKTVNFFQSDIYAMGLLLLSLACNRVQPHIPLEDEDLYKSARKWHLSCSLRSPATIDRYIRKLDGFVQVKYLDGLITRMVSSNPYDRLQTIEDAFTHRIFLKAGYDEPVKGEYSPFVWQIPEHFPKIASNLMIGALNSLSSNLNIRTRPAKFVAEAVIHMVNYLHYVNFLTIPLIKKGPPYMIDQIKLSNKISGTDFIKEVSLGMTISKLMGIYDLKSLSVRSKHSSMFDEYLILSGGHMFLSYQLNSNDKKSLSPLGIYASNHNCTSIDDYLCKTDNGSVKNPFKRIATELELGRKGKKLTISEYKKLVTEIVRIIC